jgi:limonene-1,2-epoxide hydrolase
MDTKEISVFKSFVQAINQADISALNKLMTEDHTFVDSGGNTESGREKMTEGWKEYFQMFPDFKIEIECIIQDKETMGGFGHATGTYNGNRGLVSENRIEMPAAWKAVVEGEKISYWQVYADWSEGSKIIEEDQKQV